MPASRRFRLPGPIGFNTTNTAANQVAVGGQTAATARTVTGVAPGAVSATSLDAVNGSQLFATNQNVAALQSDFVNMGSTINKADRRASGGTAVAIAMGGLAFLPDKKFNLTGNVGYYRHKWAGALNVGALISDSAAINAGSSLGDSVLSSTTPASRATCCASMSTSYSTSR